MTAFLISIVAGALIMFAGPWLVPGRFRGPDYGYLGTAVNVTLRGIGLVVILLAIASTSYIHVGDGHLAQLFRIYGGGSLTGGRIVAINGENGPQGHIVRPGFHPAFLINILYDVDGS